MYKIYWLTGLPCSGKTTIAKELKRKIHAEMLDGDDIRAITHNQDFSSEGRKKHMLGVAELAYRLSKYNNVIVSLVSPIKAVRDEIKNKYSNVIEIFINCDVEECKRRDVKGMYAKALNGEIKQFTGVSAPYEVPDESTTTVDTINTTVQECVDHIISEHYKPKKYCFFIGRWQPLHDEHIAIMNEIKKEGKNILVGIGNNGVDDKNHFSVQERIEMIKEKLPEAETVVLPDIEAVCYGKNVECSMREINLPEDTQNIRKQMDIKPK